MGVKRSEHTLQNDDAIEIIELNNPATKVENNTNIEESNSTYDESLKAAIASAQSEINRLHGEDQVRN